MIKLNLGCGSDLKEGYINIDVVREFGSLSSDKKPFLVCNLSESLPFKDESVDEIIAKDILEHFDKYMAHIVFADWVRVLKIGGRIFIRVPDFDFIFEVAKRKSLSFYDIMDLIYGEVLIGSKTYVSYFGIHKWGFNKKSLKVFGKKFGVDFLKIERVGSNLEGIGIKIKPLDGKWKKMKITSWGNRVGMGKAYVTLEEFLKIKNESKSF